MTLEELDQTMVERNVDQVAFKRLAPTSWRVTIFVSDRAYGINKTDSSIEKALVLALKETERRNRDEEA